jgi:hypothetical protein
MYRIGAKCLITECNEIAGLKGVIGEIVDMQIQENDTYTAYPLWVKILSGENKGIVHGFRYDEVAAGVDYLHPAAPFMKNLF